jgi:hypothetical protein
MRNLGIAGALALVLLNSSVALAQTQTVNARVQRAAQNQALIENRIAQFKASLRLTPEQERLWPAVETAIREAVAQYRAEDARANGFVQWMSTQAHAASGDAAYIRRAVAASQPLVKTLDPEQRRDGLKTAKSMGLASFAAAF